MRFLLGVMGMMFLAGAAAAAPGAPDESVVVTAPSAKQPQVQPNNPTTTIMCRFQDAPVGSHLGAHKTCRPLGEWRQIQANAQLDMEQTQDFYNEKYQQDLNAAGGGH